MNKFLVSKFASAIVNLARNLYTRSMFPTRRVRLTHPRKVVLAKVTRETLQAAALTGFGCCIVDCCAPVETVMPDTGRIFAIDSGETIHTAALIGRAHH